MIFKSIIFYLGCFLVTSISAQEKSSVAPLTTLSDAEVVHFQMLVEGNNRFGFDLYQHMKNQPGNLFFSSYSIVTSLGMASIGAKGETANQFQHAFRYSLPLLLFIGDLSASLQNGTHSNHTEQVLLANALWLDKSIKVLPSFTQSLKRNFRYTIEPVDFANELSQSVQKINQWISKQTAGKINNTILNQNVTTNARMILTSSAYLKGRWAIPFDRNLTKRLPFQITSQRTFMVEMMENRANYLLWKGDQWDVLAIPYEQRGGETQLAMAIILPKKGMALAELENKLTPENWQHWKSQLKSQFVALTLPSFRIDKRLDLEMSLKALGFSKLFNQEANFSGMTEQKGVYLNTAIHKTSIKIDEKGTDASGSVTPQVPIQAGKEDIPYEFVADRPFIFIIWDQKTDSIVFMGRLAIP